MRSKAWGLRLLVVHIDAGWNSEVATSNIEKLVDYCGYELYTNVISGMKCVHCNLHICALVL